MEKQEYVEEVNETLCDCPESWAIQHKTELIDIHPGYRFGCIDIAKCPCGHEAIISRRFYD